MVTQPKTKKCEHLTVIGNIIYGFKCEKCNTKISRITFLKEYNQNAIK
jgi:hypothetical protein